MSCGGGLKIRTRLCNSPKPAYGGADCSRLGPDSESSSCSTHECPGMTYKIGHIIFLFSVDNSKMHWVILKKSTNNTKLTLKFISSRIATT